MFSDDSAGHLRYGTGSLAFHSALSSPQPPFKGGRSGPGVLTRRKSLISNNMSRKIHAQRSEA
jgi:hypothetical protein